MKKKKPELKEIKKCFCASHIYCALSTCPDHSASTLLTSHTHGCWIPIATSSVMVRECVLKLKNNAVVLKTSKKKTDKGFSKGVKRTQAYRQNIFEVPYSFPLFFFTCKFLSVFFLL